jgi:hypothetical protein
MLDRDTQIMGGCPPRRRRFVPLRTMVLAHVYVFAVAMLLLSGEGDTLNNRLWAFFTLCVGALFFDYADIDLNTLQYVSRARQVWVGKLSKPYFFPIRLYALGLLYGFCILVLIFGGSLTNRVWAILLLTQFIILLSYVADDK